MNCVICGEHIEKENGYVEKHLGVSGHSAVYHEQCFLTSHEAAQQSVQRTACRCGSTEFYELSGSEYCNECGAPKPAAANASR